MHLPNASAAIVDLQKIRDYLLNEAHPDNGGKARFFMAAGFGQAVPEALAAALREFAQNVSVASSVSSPHGIKYILEGPIQTPSGRMPMIRTVWIMDRGSAAPRLVTAYPISEAQP
jgi:hypothetical protein